MKPSSDHFCTLEPKKCESHECPKCWDFVFQRRALRLMINRDLKVKGLPLRPIMTHTSYNFAVLIQGEELNMINLRWWIEGTMISSAILTCGQFEVKGNMTTLPFTLRFLKPGPYKLRIVYKDLEIEATPFALKVNDPPPPDPLALVAAKTCFAIGKNISRVYCGVTSHFVVTTEKVSDNGEGPLTVTIDTPNGIRLTPFDRKLSRWGSQIRFQTFMEGVHWVSVLWDGVHISGSPFMLKSLKPLSSGLRLESKESRWKVGD